MNRAAIIDEFKGAWLVLENLAPERMTAPRKVATISIDLVCAQSLGAVSDENAHHGHRFSPAKVTVKAERRFESTSDASSRTWLPE